MGKAGQIVTQSLDGNLFDNLFQEIQLETSRAKLRRVAVDGHSFLILLVDFSNFVVVNSKRTLRFCTCDDRGDSYLSFTSRDLVFLFCDWEVSRLVSSFNGRRRKKTKRLVNPSRRGLERTISHLLKDGKVIVATLSLCSSTVQSSCHWKWLFFRLVLR